MPFLRNITSGLRSLFRKEQVSHELDEELIGFLEMAAEEKMKQGMSPKDALPWKRSADSRQTIPWGTRRHARMTRRFKSRRSSGLAYSPGQSS